MPCALRSLDGPARLNDQHLPVSWQFLLLSWDPCAFDPRSTSLRLVGGIVNATLLQAGKSYPFLFLSLGPRNPGRPDLGLRAESSLGRHARISLLCSEEAPQTTRPNE